MSRGLGGLALQIQEISRRADRLQAEAVELAEDVAALLQPDVFGDWALVSDSFPPLPQEYLSEVADSLRYRGLEDGPPELPRSLYWLVHSSLNCSRTEAWNRGTSAFFAGFFANIALATETSYGRRELPADQTASHWIVIYRASRELSRRVTSELCLEVALEVERDPVWESFASAAELAVFCAAAQIDVPRLERWTSLRFD